jgi:putative transposase
MIRCLVNESQIWPTWTNESCARYDRNKLRYPSDLADDERAIIALLISSVKRRGNKRSIVEPAAANAIIYVLSTRCEWAPLPKNLPRSTLNDYFRCWDYDGPSSLIIMYVH